MFLAGKRPASAGFSSPDPERRKKLAVFLKAAGLKFRSLELLDLSFTHRSISNESSRQGNNERLEFLGDAILGAVCATVLYTDFAGKSEGDLAKIKSVVVSEDILSSLARELQIDNFLILGKGEELSGGREKNAILADALEALIGALYLDSGFGAVFSFVERCIRPEIDRVIKQNYHEDSKSLLQELSQRYFKVYPQYRLINRSGPDHERLFRMEVQVGEGLFGPGMGRSKKAAEQEAARIALEQLKGEFNISR
ncbi:MAG: ribonuclease III [Treponema sp.]|jgi:ribonuclease-3|nr:ribonuclease III [Treponema sp.]